MFNYKMDTREVALGCPTCDQTLWLSALLKFTNNFRQFKIAITAGGACRLVGVAGRDGEWGEGGRMQPCV